MTVAGFAEQLESQRGALLRYARLQLRNDAWAQDAVSETLLAALEHPNAFSGRSQLATWLIGILKHKIIDQLRRRSREEPLQWELEPDREEQHIEFSADGHFAHPPADWGDPEASLREAQFLRVMEACVADLPAQMGRVFLMREWLELESDDICKELAISTTNLWVLLHRARLRLRACLEIKWFNHLMP